MDRLTQKWSLSVKPVYAKINHNRRSAEWLANVHLKKLHGKQNKSAKNNVNFFLKEHCGLQNAKKT